jgi:hypothetical protein
MHGFVMVNPSQLWRWFMVPQKVRNHLAKQDLIVDECISAVERVESTT